MKKIRIEIILLVLMFTFMTFFFIIMVNQTKINDINNLYYNNFYSQNAVRFRLSKTTAETEGVLRIDPSSLPGEFVLYNSLEDKLDAPYDQDRVRVIYLKGDRFPKPHIIAGHFFSEEDILSDELLCVVGMSTFDRGVTSDGYYSYYDALSGRNLKCKVIGIIGMKNGAVSDVDVTVMVNWNGYYSGFDRISGTFYIDSDSKSTSDSVFSGINKQVSDCCTVEDEFTAREMILVGNIRSFSYFTYYLYVLGAAVLTVNIIIVSLRYGDSQKRKIAVKKLCGFSGTTVYLETTALMALISLIGLTLGLAATAFLRMSVEFRCSETGYYTALSPDVVIIVCIAVIIYSFAVAVFPSVKAYMTDTSDTFK